MPSIRARLVNRYIRSTMKKIPLHELEPVDLRRMIEARAVPFHSKKVTVETVTTPIAGEWQRPNALDGRGPFTLLYLHGGGYVFGSPKTHRSISFPLAQGAGAEVFSLDYRLAPENPCPAAIEDAVAAFKWLLSTGRAPSQICVAGDSAGGGLALSMMQALAREGLPQPACAVLYSPYTDLAGEGASVTANAESDAMFQAESIRIGGLRYAGTVDVKDGRCSPLYGDFAGLPPTLVFASKSEMLYDDATRAVEKARSAGRDVTFVERDGLIHVWPVFHPLMPEAREAIDQSVAFMASHAVERDSNDTDAAGFVSSSSTQQPGGADNGDTDNKSLAHGEL
ncbi:MAG: alpha/beta hydrolase [Pseudomonadota bacterium]